MESHVLEVVEVDVPADLARLHLFVLVLFLFALVIVRGIRGLFLVFIDLFGGGGGVTIGLR